MRRGLVLLTAVVLGLGVAACGASGPDTYDVPLAQAHDKLVAAPVARFGGDGTMLNATRFETEDAAPDLVVWRVYEGPDVRYRLAARLQAAGDGATRIAIEHLPAASGRFAADAVIAGDAANPQARRMMVSAMAEQIAAILEDREYDRERVLTRYRSAELDDPGQVARDIAAAPPAAAAAMQSTN